jgi:(p)ppGpp synthase/HD superfamily hydrolase
MTETPEKIFRFAAEAHHGQMRKYASEPYINHPKRVMGICMKVTNDECVLAAALLHDVLEDTEVTEDQMIKSLKTSMSHLEAGMTLQYVRQLTDVFIKNDYPYWNRRKRKSMELQRLTSISANAQTIKYADIIDNSKDVAKNDKGFASVLLREYDQILRELTMGNPQLRETASRMVSGALAAL